MSSPAWSDQKVRIGENVAKSWNRIETWLAVFALGVGLIILAGGGLWVYISATTKPIYPNAQDVNSVAGATPARQWSDAAERARQVIRAAVAEQNLPGLSVAVGAGNEMVWAEGFGLASLESKTPVSPETRFRIGTASAALTSAAAGLLLEQDKLKLDEKVEAYVPEFQGQQWPATLRQVMGHVAGVRSDGGDEGPLYGQQCDRPVDALTHFDTSLRFEPGTEYRFRTSALFSSARRSRPPPTNRSSRSCARRSSSRSAWITPSPISRPSRRRIRRRRIFHGSRRIRATARTRCARSICPAIRVRASFCRRPPTSCASRWL